MVDLLHRHFVCYLLIFVKSRCGLMLVDNSDKEGVTEGEDKEADLTNENTGEDTNQNTGEDIAEDIGENVGVDLTDDVILFSSTL
jgi:hypothetical protein